MPWISTTCARSWLYAAHWCFYNNLLQTIHCPVLMKPCLSNGSILLYCTGNAQASCKTCQPLLRLIRSFISNYGAEKKCQKSIPESLAPFPVSFHGADPSTPRGCFAAHRSPNGPRHAILCEPAGAVIHGEALHF